MGAINRDAWNQQGVQSPVPNNQQQTLPVSVPSPAAVLGVQPTAVSATEGMDICDALLSGQLSMSTARCSASFLSAAGSSPLSSEVSPSLVSLAAADGWGMEFVSNQGLRVLKDPLEDMQPEEFAQNLADRDAIFDAEKSDFQQAGSGW